MRSSRNQQQYPYRIPLVGNENSSADLNDHHRYQQMLRAQKEGSASVTPPGSGQFTSTGQVQGSCSRVCFWVIYVLMGIGAVFGIAAMILAILVATNAVRTISGVSPKDANIDMTGGTGISTVANIPQNEVIINNDGVLSVNSVNPVSGNMLLSQGAGVNIGTGVPSEITIANTGVLSNIQGDGISVSGATGDVTVTNTGVVRINSIVADTGDFTVTGGSFVSVAPGAMGASEIVINNDGVTQITGTTGITPVSATSGSVTLAHDAVRTINGQSALVNAFLINPGNAGISVDNGASNEIEISNDGVLDLTGGIAIGVSATTGSVTINNEGVTSAIGGDGISVDVATGDVTFTNDGVIATNDPAGSGISTSGTNPLEILHRQSTEYLTKTDDDSTGKFLRLNQPAATPAAPSASWTSIGPSASANAVDGGFGRIPTSAGAFNLPESGLFAVHAHCDFTFTDVGGAAPPADTLTTIDLAIGIAGAPGVGYVPPGGTTRRQFTLFTTLGPMYMFTESSVDVHTMFHVCSDVSCDASPTDTLLLYHKVAQDPVYANSLLATTCDISIARIV